MSLFEFPATDSEATVSRPGCNFVYDNGCTLIVRKTTFETSVLTFRSSKNCYIYLLMLMSLQCHLTLSPPKFCPFSSSLLQLEYSAAGQIKRTCAKN